VIAKQEAITMTFCHGHNQPFLFCMKGLNPTVLTQPSPLNNRFYPVPVHNVQAMVESLLYLLSVKDDKNLLFPNPDDLLAPPPAEVKNIADINTGHIYRKAYKNLCTCPNHVVCGIICYIDNPATGWHGHLSLEPVYFTLSIPKKKTEIDRRLGVRWDTYQILV
jgi:hypothetical protein